MPTKASNRLKGKEGAGKASFPGPTEDQVAREGNPEVPEACQYIDRDQGVRHRTLRPERVGPRVGQTNAAGGTATPGRALYQDHQPRYRRREICDQHQAGERVCIIVRVSPAKLMRR